MRILHLVSYSLYSGPLPPTVGLALAERRAGHEVWLAYDTKRGGFSPHEEAAAPRLLGLKLEPPWSFAMSAKSSLRELWRDRATLRELMRRELVDVVHVHLSHDHLLAALALPRASGPKLVRTIHAARSLARRPGQALLFRRADAFITRGEEHARLLAQRFAKRDVPCETIPSGFDAAGFSPKDVQARRAARARFELPEQAFVVAHVALITSRGQLELARAIAELASNERPHVLFVGRGEGEPALRAQVEALGISSWIRFAGYLTGDEELMQAYAAADVAFLAQAGNDASARAGLEAMAAGVPLIAVAKDALSELVVPARGYPIASRDPSVIAAALRAAFAEPRESAARAEEALRYIRHERTFEREAAATIDLYLRTRHKS